MDEEADKEIPFSPIPKNSVPFTPKSPNSSNNFTFKSEESLKQELNEMKLQFELNAKKLKKLEQNITELMEKSSNSSQIMV